MRLIGVLTQKSDSLFRADTNDLCHGLHNGGVMRLIAALAQISEAKASTLCFEQALMIFVMGYGMVVL